MLRLFCVFSLALAGMAVRAETNDLARAVAPAVPQTDGEVWNLGVDYYRAGDVTNALVTLRPLTLSKTHGARAAELVARIEYATGDLEAASADAQLALRAAPDDAKANRNFTRTVDRLPQLRAEERVKRLLKEAEGQDPGARMQAATHEARALLEAAGTFRTNAPVRAVALADALAARAERLADVWIPLRELLAHSVTNQEQAQTIILQAERAEENAKKAAKAFADLDAEAYAASSDVEHDCTRFLKLVAAPPAALAEDTAAQSNAWMDVAATNGRSWQQDALDFTRTFRRQFPAWARAYEQQAQADTNRPPFTAEDQAKISALANELEKAQMECVDKNLPPNQEKALDLLRQIGELMPRDPNGGKGQQNQNPQQNPQKNPQQNPQQPPQQPQQPGAQPQDEPKDGEKDKQKDAGDEGEESEEEKDIEAVLKKAQERSDEHEAEKKARMRKAPLPPNERDW